MNSRVNILLFSLVLILDQVTKHMSYTYLEEGLPVTVIPNIFNLTLVYNPGAAFGMFGTLPDVWRRVVLIAVSLIALLVVCRFMLHEAKDDKVAQGALGAILAGALGNIADRIRFDSVVDFLDFYWKHYHWPAFNVADSAISLGVTVLVFRILFAAHPQAAAEPVNTVKS